MNQLCRLVAKLKALVTGPTPSKQQSSLFSENSDSDCVRSILSAGPALDEANQCLYVLEDVKMYFPHIPVEKLLVLPEPGYRVELGSLKNDAVENPMLEEVQENSRYYKNNFASKKHVNYLGGTSACPVSVSMIRTEKVGGDKYGFSAIVRSKKNDHICSFISKNDRTALKYLRSRYAQVHMEPLVRVKSPLLVKDLVHIESSLIPRGYKIGVVYAARESEENAIFSNRQPSSGFKAFLRWLGERVRLRGWTKFSGGLDLRADTTGTHSYFTTFQSFDVMFHVSTELPYCDKDSQQVERKRHIGNDVAIIVYQDGAPAKPFAATSIKSRFNQVYVIVQAVNNDPSEAAAPSDDASDDGEKAPRDRAYKLAVISKQGVRSYGPSLPRIGYVWKLDETFREFLLTKLVNAERAAYYAPEFAQTRTRRILLKDLLEKY